MDLLHTEAELLERLGASRCVAVPTMGALHEGHLSLIDRAREIATRSGQPVAATIFVNPAQFNDPADLERYPRPIERDLVLLEQRGVDVVFAPGVATVYPPENPSAWPQPEVPEVGRLPGLEDRFRPGHFAGVCRVVSRLFDLLNPSAAVFGEKDWQQTRVVAAMCEQQGRDLSIAVAPTVREHDGLAMSSRNAQLPADQRFRAAAVIRGIRAAHSFDEPGKAIAEAEQVLRDLELEIEYVAIRDAETLIRTPAGPGDGVNRILVAARLAGVRLLDNAPWQA